MADVTTAAVIERCRVAVADRAAAISQATFCTLIRDHHKSWLLEIRLALDHGHRTATLHTHRRAQAVLVYLRHRALHKHGGAAPAVVCGHAFGCRRGLRSAHTGATGVQKGVTASVGRFVPGAGFVFVCQRFVFFGQGRRGRAISRSGADGAAVSWWRRRVARKLPALRRNSRNAALNSRSVFWGYLS